MLGGWGTHVPCLNFASSYVVIFIKVPMSPVEISSQRSCVGDFDLVKLKRNLMMYTVPARVLVKKQRPIWLEQFITKENTVKTETIYESYEWQRAKYNTTKRPKNLRLSGLQEVPRCRNY